jgi:pimeloyl-ACP methyl ester carboxylesterase
MSAAAPVAGDVLYYQSKGAEIRAFVRERVEALNDDVVLVAHSLGGIACFELLVEEALPAVTKLVTVGSQAPLLYEIDALVSLAYGSELPGHFPAWLNVYDRYDFLSFCAEGLFAGRVTDVEVSNGQPFPQSHSAYWTNAAVWRAVGAFLA